MSEEYKISLGINFNDSELKNVKRQLTNLTDNTHRIRIDIDNSRLLKQISHAKKELKELSGTKGKQPSLTFNTESLEQSFKKMSDVIEEVRKSLGTLDDKSGMQSLVASVNQIATALGNVESESDSLVKSLSALSKKDFNVNIGLKIGGSSSVSNTTAYGDYVRRTAVPELRKQVDSLMKAIREQYKTEFSSWQSDEFILESLSRRNSYNHMKSIGLLQKEVTDSKHLAKQMAAYSEYIDLIEDVARLSNVDTSGIAAGFSRTKDDIIQSAFDIQSGVKTAAKNTEESFEKLKQVFGGGSNLNLDGLLEQLKPIVDDLKLIREAIQSLSKGISIDGLTASFNKLSETLEKLSGNLVLTKAKLDAMSTGSSGGLATSAVSDVTSATDKIEKESAAYATSVVQNEKKKQEAYKATTDTVMYHAGIVSKLNKAETNGRFYGSNRGTGYFGTGHYFVDYATKHQLDNSPSYKRLPYTSIDISQYDNLFKVTSDEIGYELHRFLKNLTRFTQGADDFSVDELFAQFKNVFGDAVMDVKEFSSKMEQLKSFMSKSDFYDRSDSVSTQFMKSLGYGGVDTRGTRLADTEYGTVIYDLKEESVLQANITDELQKQGQMLEKINYEKGQVFDKDTDAKIQRKLDEEAKRKEITDEFERSFDSTNLDKVSDDLADIKKRIDAINGAINEFKYNLDNLDQAYEDNMNFMNSLGFDDDEIFLVEDEDEWKKNHAEIYKSSIEDLSAERAELEAQASTLEEALNKESQLANEAYEKAKQTVEQRWLEAQAIKQVSDATDSIETNTGLEKVENDFREIASVASNLDDVLDQQTLSLMDKYSIIGDKGSKSFNEIRQALVECRNELNILNNSDIGIDEEVFDASRAVDKVTDAIANQHRAVNNLGDEYVELANYMTRFNDPAKGNKVRLPEFVKQEQGDSYKSSRASLGNAFNTERGISFADFINDLNHELGNTISLTNGEAAAMDELLRKVELGRRQRDALKKSEKSLTSTASTEEILEQNGISREEIYGDVMSIVGIVESAEQQIVQASAQAANVVSQNEERKQQAYRETAGVIENLKTTLETMKVDRSSIDTVIKDMEELGFTATDTSVKMKNGGFDITVKGVDSIGRAITEIRHLDSATDTISLVDRKISQSLTESDKFIKQQKKAVTDLTNQINQSHRSAIDQNANRPIKDSEHLTILESKYNEITAAIQKMGSASSNTFDEERNNVNALISDFKSLTREFKNAENSSSQWKGNDYESGRAIAVEQYNKFLADAKGFRVDTSKLNIDSVTDVASLNKFTDTLRVAKAELAKIKAEVASTKRVFDSANRSKALSIDVTDLRRDIESLQNISPEIKDFKTKINGADVTIDSLLRNLNYINVQSDFRVAKKNFELFTKAAQEAGIAVTKVQKEAKDKLANGIKLDIELGNFDEQIDAMRVKFNSLSDANDELRRSYNATEDAYRAMLNAAKANTGDEVADREQLIQSEKEYAAALEKTNNLIKMQARADRIDSDAEKLADKKTALKLDMSNYLKDNSRAAKEFGDEIRRLSSLLDNVDLDDVGVNKISRTFKNLTKEIKNAGKDGLTVFDRLKSKVKEYMTYLSAAEVFMYAEQALRSMFEQVKLIDSAMTELKKVTDETDTAYNNFLSNAASRAKEIGTTIDGLVSSTADFARLGYNMSDAANLAEVANIYAVVGDDIDSVQTATESLISTMTAFGVEASNSMSIVDKFNAVGNHFAISSGGIGEALERSASSMAAANNSLDETIALITAANTVVQDADSVGTAFKTISMRIKIHCPQ